MRRELLLVFVLAGAVAGAPRPGSAQKQCATGGMALVQTRLIFGSIDRYATQDTAVAIAVNGYTVDVARLQGIIDSASRAYQEKSMILTAVARQAERRKLDAQNAQVQQQIRDRQLALGQQRDRLLRPIENGVQAVIDSVRVDLKCAIIFDVSSSGSVVSVNKSLDVTQRVIDRIRATGDTALFGPPRKP